MTKYSRNLYPLNLENNERSCTTRIFFKILDSYIQGHAKTFEIYNHNTMLFKLSEISIYINYIKIREAKIAISTLRWVCKCFVLRWLKWLTCKWYWHQWKSIIIKFIFFGCRFKFLVLWQRQMYPYYGCWI